MADEPQKTLWNPITTDGFPIVYANLASLTANYNDLRIYFADAQAKTIATLGATTQTTVSEANIAPRICMVMTPEFAKSLLDALSGTIAVYEKQFGPLRPAPQMPTQASTPKPAGKA